MAKNIKKIEELSLASLPQYRLMHHEYLSDIESMGLVFRHEKSGARICVISGDDDNKLFCAAFRTPPTDSTGVPHIIEHTVLCGSDRFPARDPFMQLVKGSLNTFLNAMTFPDKTMYPVGSCNDKDFQNLMHVYMDAVFHPNIYKHKEIFMQEGWHYEMEQPEDELTINGIVYSEMKGALSSAMGQMEEEMQQAMFPDNTYGVNSGGDPDVIPSLTYEDYLDFHSRYYHPTNSYIFLYGDVDVEERLNWLDAQYLSGYDKIDIDSHVEPQKPFGFRKVTKSYSIAAEESKENKYFYGYSAACGSNLNTEDCWALDLLGDVLLYAPGAPVKQALLDAGIGQDITGGFSDHMLQPVFQVIAKNAAEGKAEEFYRTVRQTLQKLVTEGISKKSLLATINIREFRYRESDFGGFPKGLVYSMDILQSWLYDENSIFDRMHGGELYASLKAKIDTDYYEKLIEKYLLSDEHSVLLTLEPENGLLDRKNEALRAELAAKKASMTPAEIDAIVAETKALRDYQSAEPTEEELTCIPTLAREDIKREAPVYQNEEKKIGDIPVLYHDLQTNGISYVQLMFDLPALPTKYLPYLGLLGSVLGQIDTDKHSFKDLSEEVKIHTGGIGYELASYDMYGKADESRNVYEISIHAIGDKVAYGLDLVKEVLTGSVFEDTKRLREILGAVVSAKQSRLQQAGHAASLDRARSYYSVRGCYKDMVSGITAYEKLKDILQNFDAEKDTLVANLKALTAAIFRADNLWLDVAADEAGYGALEGSIGGFAKALDACEHPDLGVADAIVPERKNEGIMMALGVQYVGRVGNLFKAGYGYTGALQVLANALNIDYLYSMIRVRGGAYGCGCGFSPSTGDVMFYSYRDPNCKKTEDVYLGTPDFVRALSMYEAELTRCIIGTFSGYERPMSPKQKAEWSMAAYVMGKTHEDLQRERDQMLDVTMSDLTAAADMIEAVLNQHYSCTIGNEQTIRQNSEMFETLKSLS